MKLSTIQKRNNLNIVHANGDIGPGGAYHHYEIAAANHDELGHTVVPTIINFQKGPRNEPDSIHGVVDGDLLEVVRHRLQCFQAGEFACRENAIALTHIEEALMWMNKRAEDRAERNVLGTYNK